MRSAEDRLIRLALAAAALAAAATLISCGKGDAPGAGAPAAAAGASARSSSPTDANASGAEPAARAAAADAATASTAPAAEAAPTSPAPAAASPADAPSVSADTLFTRLAVIGASATDGFGVSVREDGAKPGEGIHVSLADILRTAATHMHPVEQYASSMVFANPGPILSGEIDRALRRSPTLVVGADFLFWYVYGTVDAQGAPMRSREDRLANLDRGLAQVDRVLAQRIPFIVGDVPDMKAAIGRMLSRAQVPDAQTLDAANARIGEWARSRPGVRIVSLRDCVSSIVANGSMRAGGRDWTVGDHGPLLLDDELHPSFPGTVAVASGIVDVASLLLPEADRPALIAQFDFDPSRIRQRLLDGRTRRLDVVP